MQIHFFRNIDRPDFYFLVKGGDGLEKDIDRRFRVFTHQGEYENSGFHKVNIEKGNHLKVKLKLGNIREDTLNDEFFRYLYETVATDCDPYDFYNAGRFRAWYQFKSYEPEKWVKDFYEYYSAELERYNKPKQKAIQGTLF